MDALSPTPPFSIRFRQPWLVPQWQRSWRGHGVGEGEAGALGEGEAVALAEGDADGDADGLVEGLALGDGLTDGVPAGVADGLATAFGEGVGLPAALTVEGGFRTEGRPPDPLLTPNGCGPDGLAVAKATTRPAKAAKASPSGMAAIEDRPWYPSPVEREELR